MKFSFIMIRIYNSIACGIKLMNFQNTLTMSYDLLEFFSLWKKKNLAHSRPNRHAIQKTEEF